MPRKATTTPSSGALRAAKRLNATSMIASDKIVKIIEEETAAGSLVRLFRDVTDRLERLAPDASGCIDESDRQLIAEARAALARYEGTAP